MTLIAGLLVRPMALGWGLIFWTFVAALPVVTVAGVAPDLDTHRTPALLVLVRDMGLSGLFFTLFVTEEIGVSFPVGYDLTVDQMRALGLYVSEPRSMFATRTTIGA